MTKSNMSVKVEFLAGTSIESALDEAKEKANLWNVAYIEFDFNGVKVLCQKDFTTEYWKEKVLQAIRYDEIKFVICSSRSEK